MLINLNLAINIRIKFTIIIIKIKIIKYYSKEFNNLNSVVKSSFFIISCIILMNFIPKKKNFILDKSSYKFSN